MRLKVVCRILGLGASVVKVYGATTLMGLLVAQIKVRVQSFNRGRRGNRAGVPHLFECSVANWVHLVVRGNEASELLVQIEPFD